MKQDIEAFFLLIWKVDNGNQYFDGFMLISVFHFQTNCCILWHLILTRENISSAARFTKDTAGHHSGITLTAGGGKPHITKAQGLEQCLEQ